tara:strand:- start:39 stop:386 length:348 start_codon:yes stop_codon:yes gene_type:complete
MSDENEIDTTEYDDADAAFQAEQEGRRLEDAQDAAHEIAASRGELPPEEQVVIRPTTVQEYHAHQIAAAFRDYVKNYGWTAGSSLLNGPLLQVNLDAIWEQEIERFTNVRYSRND